MRNVSLFRSFFSLTRMLAVAAVAIAASVVHRVGETFKIVALRVLNVLASPAKMDRTGLPTPNRLLHAAQAFHARMVKLKRPALHGSWRVDPFF